MAIDWDEVERQSAVIKEKLASGNTEGLVVYGPIEGGVFKPGDAIKLSLPKEKE